MNDRFCSALGHPRLHSRQFDSTNARARSLAEGGAPHGALVTAEHQSAGRGRHGRAWTAPRGEAVLMSLVLRGLTGSGAESTARISLLPLIAAVAVAETLSDELGEPDRVALKWPNDVWIDRRKVAGVLVEGRFQENWAVLGIGVNVTTPESGLPASLRTRASSLAIASKSGSKSAPEPVLAALLDQLERWLAAEPAGILEAWRARDGLRGSNIRWSDGEGRAAGVDDTGALLVRTPEGMVRLTAGEVSPGGSTPAAT